jgi:HEAT repeat protein
MLPMTVAKILLALASFQEPGPQTPGPLMWTGQLSPSVTAPQSVKLPQERDAAGYAAMLRAALAELKTKTELARDFDKQVYALEWLRAEASWQLDYPGKAEIHAEIAGVRADWLDKLGRRAAAVDAAWHPFVMPGESTQAPYDRLVWVASNGKLAELVDKTDALPAMIELHKRFPSNAPATKGRDAIEEAVRQEVLNGNPVNLTNFGTRCVPALLKILRENPKQMNERYPAENANQPLGVLLQIDRSSANSLLLETIGSRGPDWTMRAIFCLSNLMVTSYALTPSSDPNSPPTSSDALTLQVIDALAKDGMPSGRLFTLLEPLVGNDIVSPAVRDFLLGQVRATDQSILSPLRSMLDGVRVGPNKRVLYEAFLDSPDPDLRARCAQALSLYPVGPATLRATQHPDPSIRGLALDALVRHRVWPYDYRSNSYRRDTTGSWQDVPRTPEIEVALLRLAKDPERNVRMGLASALLQSGETPPEPVLEALLADEQAAVRMALLGGGSTDPTLLARIFGRLAADEDPKVLGYLASALCSRSRASNRENPGEFPRYLPAVATLLANPRLSLKEPQPWKNLLTATLETPEGARIVFDACVRGPRKAEFLPLLLENIPWTPGNSGVPIRNVLPAQDLAELFALGQSGLDVNRQEWSRRAVQREIDTGSIDPAPFLALARGGQYEPFVLLRLLEVGAEKAGPADAEAYLTVLRAVKPEEIDPEKPDTRTSLQACTAGFRTNGWPAAALAGLAPRLIADPAVPDLLALKVASSMLDWTQEKLDAAATGICLERWARLGSEGKYQAGSLLKFLDPRVDARVLRLWREELPSLARHSALLNAIQAHPVDESVDLLGEIITSTELSMTVEYRERAVSLLTRRLDEPGADALLKAIASAPSEAVRQKCFEGLEQIRKYQDEKQSWQKRKGGEAAREQAIADLLPMLGDKDAGIRSAAARSLATLRAVEHLPKIVALLKDKDASVREAAQKALDALNAPESKKP